MEISHPGCLKFPVSGRRMVTAAPVQPYPEGPAAVGEADGALGKLDPHPDGLAWLADVPGVLQQLCRPAPCLGHVELVADAVHSL